MKLKTYIINLEKSTVRKQYMQDLLSGYDFLDVTFIQAIDGRLLSDEERRLRFEFDKSRDLYGKTVNAGEVGCALSHRKTYETILAGAEPYALVLEDDISIIRDLKSLDMAGIDSVLTGPGPRVLMLSGDYWYYKRKPIVRLFSAVGAYAYIINKAAAQRILSVTPPFCVADDWMFYKRLGLKMFAVYPYMIDANMNMDLLSSDVKQDNWTVHRSQMSLKENIIGLTNGFLKKMFKLFGHFEFKVRIFENNIVERIKNPLK